ncbi:PorT family protein [Flavobacterium gawalongense]|uniref:PorT family protein n=2 Tax=Flavobacteriaceae TaxID=49546 RepID=A0A553BPL2_9FLAO|nr:porin family protein [Flavobacterium gawalongense]TRX01591.1 PorT family protein [Flavobacterium gawalongense]TRX06159.1 PorT family protein [Flavobacterium gawalongense]TRX10187.1 PorT family protein [Flavobacterium gawalongense]TRX11118.1 PorT family protein [Flavobacterium gawalongense]TRX28849.1 PorT family protein [Flavobacterium gawalongense]
MKNSKTLIYASLVLTFMAFTSSKAQENETKTGIKGGVNFSNLYTDDVDDNDVLTGFNVGFYAKLPIADNIALQPEISYTGKGAELVYNNAFVSGTAQFKLDYIEVPLLLVVNVTKNFNIHAGPYAAYLISGKTTNKSDDGSYNFEDNIDTDDFNRFDAGLAGGVGLDLEPVSFGVRYNYGLTKIGKDDSANNFTSPDAKNSVLSFYAAFSF